MQFFMCQPYGYSMLVYIFYSPMPNTCFLKFSRTIFLFLFLSFSLANAVTTIAVVDFEARGIPKHEAEIIADRIRTELVQSGLFKVMERGQMESILKEQGFQQSGVCSDASCLVEVGQLLAVEKIVTGSVGKIGEMYTLNVKLIDVKTGEILITHNEDVSGKIEDIILKKAVPRITSKLVQGATMVKLKVGYLNVASKPEGATVRIDTQICGTTPVTKIERPAGETKVVLSLQNYVSQEHTVAIELGKTQELLVTLTPTQEYLTQKREETAKKKAGFRKVTRWLTGSVAVAGLCGAGYFYYTAEKSYTDYKSESDPEKASTTFNKVKTAENGRNILGAVGAVGALGLAVSFVF